MRADFTRQWRVENLDAQPLFSRLFWKIVANNIYY